MYSKVPQAIYHVATQNIFRLSLIVKQTRPKTIKQT